jgi:glycosyltransferase involved in cell wall biosynthesis
MAELVSIGVPVFRGAQFVQETLHAIRAQTHREIDVLISIDGGDEGSATACEPFVRADSRFRMVVHENRLGWADNISYLMSQNRGDFWYFNQQDDLVTTDYIDALLEHALANTSAAVTYCDIQAFGNYEAKIVQNSLLGTGWVREVYLLIDHMPAVALRGLTRAKALRQAAGIRRNEIECFAADTTWLASVARAGELHRVPRVLYYKRYHEHNVHTKWASWSTEKLERAWHVHCRDMVLEALRVDATVDARRLIWFAALTKLSGKSPYLQFQKNMVADASDVCLANFFKSFNYEAQAFVENLLNLSWKTIEVESHRLLGLARRYRWPFKFIDAFRRMKIVGVRDSPQEEKLGTLVAAALTWILRLGLEDD